MTPTIDLNADVGEDPTPEGIARDAAMALHVTSLNIACGGHAGDDASMTRLVRIARERGLGIGAHPSYPDRVNFGRAELTMTGAEIERRVEEQLQALVRIALRERTSVAHIKPHGALYHAARRIEVAEAIARACARTLPGAVLVGQHGSPALDVWSGMGLPTGAEAFADRVYEPDGSLRSRTKPGAVIDDAAAVTRQALEIAADRRVTASDGTRLSINAETICLHSDTPGAAELAASVRDALAASGVCIQRLTL